MRSEMIVKLVQQSQTQLLRSMAEITQAVAAERSGLDATLVSRMVSGKDAGSDGQGAVERVLALAAACNLTLRPLHYKQIDPEEYRAMQVLAQKRLADVQSTDWGLLP